MGPTSPSGSAPRVGRLRCPRPWDLGTACLTRCNHLLLVRGVGMILLDGAPVASLEEYVKRGGGAALGIAVESGPDHVLDELGSSGLRGRGGAGFSTALKWRSIVAGGAEAGERFVVANGAEGEPGTFKDRALLRHNPYLMLEGLLVAARTVGARRVFCVEVVVRLRG